MASGGRGEKGELQSSPGQFVTGNKGGGTVLKSSGKNRGSWSEAYKDEIHPNSLARAGIDNQRKQRKKWKNPTFNRDGSRRS